MEQREKIEDLDTLIARVRPYLRRYLEERNVEIDDKGCFRCINPKHEDKNPSCGFVKDTDEQIFNCFSCGAKGNILNAANLLEGKPLRGKEFVTDNVAYIADKYGVEYNSIEFTPEELHRRRTYRAYNDAADIISKEQPFEYIKVRKWPTTLCRELQIGCVVSYEDFLAQMNSRGYDNQFLDEVDLNRFIFNNGMLIFTVRDERGRVVGFSARDMHHSKDSKRLKFINTSSKCQIYNKGVILYGLDVAKDYQPPLYIFEGYPDYVTAYKCGIKNVCAIGGTALTRDHINLLKEIGITDIILALDGDAPGQMRTEKLLDEYFAGDETIKIRLIKLPSTADECDPDEYIEKYGPEAFKALPLLTPFQWRLDRFNYDTKPEEICDKMIPFIVSDPNEIHREVMARELSDKTGIRLKTVIKQVDKLINFEEAQKAGVVQTKVRQLVEDLRAGRSDPASIMEVTANEIRQINSDTKEDTYSSMEVMSSLDITRSTFENRKPGLQGWTSGYPALDKAISGIPKVDTMITLAGDSNVGKTALMFELALRMAKLNPDIMVLFMTIDDSRQQALSRMVCLEAGLRIDQVTHPQQNTTGAEDQEKLVSGWRSITKLIEENKLSIKDSSHGNTLDFAEGWIRWARDNHPNREIAFFLDNFHKLGDEREKEERIRFKHASARIQHMKTKLQCAAICTMELRKFLGAGGNQRPSLQDISESKQMEYDNNMIGMVYSDVQAKRAESKIFWLDGEIKKPVLEVDIQKNKISDYKGVLYFRFDPPRSSLSEASSDDVMDWKSDYDQALKMVHDKRYPDAGVNPFLQRISEG